MKRFYKVFLVEDEIVTRQGIRDRIPWPSAGLEFSGEASDGEVALPLIQAVQPDILITDIKMPFMNGLELCKIVRETMPSMKVIILSGHDEFDYAREAIKLGVTEYLLKPLTSQDLLSTLQKVVQQLDQEEAEKERMQGLQQQVEGSQQMLREKFLLQLTLGGISTVEALEKSIRLNIDLIARGYLVALIKTEFYGDGSWPLDYARFEQIEDIISDFTRRHSDLIAFKKSLEETVLILKGDSFTHLEQDSYLLIEELRQEVENRAQGRLKIGASKPCDRIGDIPRAFFEALEGVKPVPAADIPPKKPQTLKPSELLRLDPTATDKYLKYGAKSGFDAYFESYVHPLKQSVKPTGILLEYMLLDLLITTANFIIELGGDVGKILPELGQCEHIVNSTSTLEEVRELARAVTWRAIDFRNERAGRPYSIIIARARNYINENFDQSALSLAEVAAHVGLSPSHFSLIFSRETGETFIEYFTRKRIEKAMELLCTTALKTSDISDRIGYDNSHYFSTVFKKITGLSPTEFRSRAHLSQ